MLQALRVDKKAEVEVEAEAETLSKKSIPRLKIGASGAPKVPAIVCLPQ